MVLDVKTELTYKGPGFADKYARSYSLPVQDAG